MRDMNPDIDVALKFRNLFIQQFSQPHRKYHNLKWAVDVSRDMRSVALYKNVRPEAMIITLWFSKLVLPAEATSYRDVCEISLQDFFEAAMGDQIMGNVAHENLVDILMDIPTSDFGRMVITGERMYMIKPNVVYDEKASDMVLEAREMDNFSYYLEERAELLGWLLTAPERGLPSPPYCNEPYRSLMIENISRELMVIRRLLAGQTPQIAESYDPEDTVTSQLYIG